MKVELNEVEHITETSATIKGSRRRTTIPKVISNKFQVKDGDTLRWVLFKDGRVLITF